MKMPADMIQSLLICADGFVTKDKKGYYAGRNIPQGSTSHGPFKSRQRAIYSAARSVIFNKLGVKYPSQKEGA